MSRLFRRCGSYLRSRRTFWIVSAFSLFALSCQLTKSEKVENTLSFSRIADTLKSFDDVAIVLKHLDGTPWDTIFNGKVGQAGDVEKLLAPHWDGSKVLVDITGTKAGKVVYQVETRFDPASGTRDDIVIIVVPDMSLSSTVKNLPLLIGNSLSLPAVSIQPPNLLDKTLEWTANSATIVLGPTFVKASQAGAGELTVRLKNNPDVKLVIPFTIVDSGLVPKNLSLQPETLEVAANGPTAKLTAKVFPSEASSLVAWKSADSNIASVDSNGNVQGKRRGETSILVSSSVRPTVQAFAHVKVTEPSAVTSVSFPKDSLNILVGGGAESLLVHVEPPDADPAVKFTVSDSLKATVQKGKISGLVAGTVSVVATSVSNPSAMATLSVKISVPTPNDTVPPVKPKVRVNPVGPTQVGRPVWSWTSGGGGSGNYQVLLDKSVFDSSATSLSDTTYKPSVDLGMGVHVLYVRERDAAGNWSLPGSAQVEIDTAGPSAPKIFGTSPTNSLPRWTWASGGGGGAGVFRSRLGDANFPTGASESTDTIFTLASAATGTTYTLYVQERDAARNWSSAANLLIKYDLTKPSVTIIVPQASGIFITASDTVTISGGTGGPNGIAKVEYTVDGGATNSITGGSSGVWNIPALKVTNAKTTVVKVTSTDNLGNTGDASISILRDADPPSPPASLSTPASPTNVSTASWSWTSGSDGVAGSGLNGKYQWKLNTGAWTVTSTAAATGVTLSEGTNSLSVQEQDKAGNWSTSVTGNIVLDTKAPDAVTFTGVDSSIATTPTPTWAWTPSVTNGGIGTYVLKLDAGSEFDWTTKTYTPTTSLSDYTMHTLTVKEKDQVLGVTGAAKSFRYKVQVGLDPTKPWGGLKNLAVKSSGCGKAPTVTSGKFTIMSSGQTRSYIIDIPATYNMNFPYRVFYCSHWIGSTSEAVQAQDYYFLKPFAGDTAIFIAPQSVGSTWSSSSPVDNILFDDILSFAKTNLCIDSTRIFATGFSFGAMMTYSLSVNRPNQIRAAVGIAPANYNIYLPAPLPHDPIAWMQTTGMSDATCPWVQSDSTKNGSKYIALQRGQDNVCTVPATIPTWQSGNHLCYDFSGCKTEFPTKACTFNGAHTNINSDSGSTANWIPQESWKFFQQF